MAALTEEILSSSEQGAFQISSEHQLCRQHHLSRVTVRLALSDLEHKGLIYRRHGKGTFAHGRTSRQCKSIALLLKSSPRPEHWPMAEVLRGIQSWLAPLRVPMVVVSAPPTEWSAEMAKDLAGALICPHGITQEDLDNLKHRKLPFIMVGESPLPEPQVRFGQTEAACKMTENLLQLGHRQIALLTGYEPGFDAAKRQGVHQALRAAQIDPASVPEYSVSPGDGGAEQAVRMVLALRPRPTAVIAFDDGFAALLSVHARKENSLKIPGDLSIASFHDSPYLRYLEPPLTTVHFDFAGVGRSAAQALNLAIQTGAEAVDVTLEPTYRPGQTVGPAWL